MPSVWFTFGWSRSFPLRGWENLGSSHSFATSSLALPGKPPPLPWPLHRSVSHKCALLALVQGPASSAIPVCGLVPPQVSQGPLADERLPETWEWSPAWVESSLSRGNSESMLWGGSVHTPAPLASLPPARGHFRLREHWVKNSFLQALCVFCFPQFLRSTLKMWRLPSVGSQCVGEAPPSKIGSAALIATANPGQQRML